MTTKNSTWQVGRTRLRMLAAAALGVTLLAVGPAHAEQSGEAVNACGCRQDSAGACYCERNAKCGCPGECEPKGCEDKRAKQLEKEVEMETRKAEAAGRQHRPSDGDDGEGSESRTSRPPEAKGARRVEHRMTTADRRTLARLLEIYAVQHPDARHMPVEEVLVTLRAEDSGKAH